MKAFVCVALATLITNNAMADATIEETIAKFPDIVEVSTVVPNLLVELKYATEDNFLKKNVYGGLRKCFLQKDAAQMLAKAAKFLHNRDPNLRLLAYDCLRPRRVQLMMWEVVKDTPQQKYVANPVLERYKILE